MATVECAYPVATAHGTDSIHERSLCVKVPRLRKIKDDNLEQMSDDQDERPESESPKPQEPNPSPSNRPMNGRRNASEIAGETIETVGESTGRFPRPTQSGGGESTGKHAFLVGAGILISRIIGVVRQRVFAHYLG